MRTGRSADREAFRDANDLGEQDISGTVGDPQNGVSQPSRGPGLATWHDRMDTPWNDSGAAPLVHQQAQR